MFHSPPSGTPSRWRCARRRRGGASRRPPAWAVAPTRWPPGSRNEGSAAPAFRRSEDGADSGTSNCGEEGATPDTPDERRALTDASVCCACETKRRIRVSCLLDTFDLFCKPQSTIIMKTTT